MPQPSRARFSDECLLVRGFGKTYGCTGWRLGYVAGPKEIVQEIAKFQQYTYVCAPSMAQWGVIPSFGVDLAPIVADYERRRQMVVDAFAGVTTLPRPGGAFYAFVEVPKRLGITGHEFVEQAIPDVTRKQNDVLALLRDLGDFVRKGVTHDKS